MLELLSGSISRHLESQILQLKLSFESTFNISTRFPDNAQGILHRTHKNLSLSGSDSPMYDVLSVVSQQLYSTIHVDLQNRTAQIPQGATPITAE